MSFVQANITYGRKLLKLSQRDLADALSVGRGSVYNWEKGLAAPPISEIISICRLFKFNIDDFLTRDIESEGFTMGAKPLSEYVDNKTLNILVPANANAGYSVGWPDQVDQVDTVVIPGVSGEARTFEISGDSMAPVILHGDFVACKRVEHLRDLRDNQVYVLVSKSEGIQCKYLQAYAEGIRCIPASPHYREFVVAYDDVKEIWEMAKRITSHVMAPRVLGDDRLSRLEKMIEEMSATVAQK